MTGLAGDCGIGGFDLLQIGIIIIERFEPKDRKQHSAVHILDFCEIHLMMCRVQRPNLHRVYVAEAYRHTGSSATTGFTITCDIIPNIPQTVAITSGRLTRDFT